MRQTTKKSSATGKTTTAKPASSSTAQSNPKGISSNSGKSNR
jgi:hypothetical protein